VAPRAVPPNKGHEQADHLREQAYDLHATEQQGEWTVGQDQVQYDARPFQDQVNNMQPAQPEPFVLKDEGGADHVRIAGQARHIVKAQPEPNGGVAHPPGAGAFKLWDTSSGQDLTCLSHRFNIALTYRWYNSLGRRKDAERAERWRCQWAR
jgi:hypothetical protein